MTLVVDLTEVMPERLAAVRVSVAPGQIGQVWKPALDQVWAFLAGQTDLRPGHNLFLYHHPAQPGGLMQVDFGVQVATDFAPQGNVRSVLTPGGRAARALHIGPIEAVSATHAALHDWCKAHGHRIGTHSWETYGHWTDDPATYEIWLTYLLA